MGRWQERWGLADREVRSLLFVLFSLLLGTFLWTVFRGVSPTFTLPQQPLPPQEQAVSPEPWPLDLNEATYRDLIEVPGIGPVLATRILQLREKLGRFQKLEDLLQVKGIGPKRLKQLSFYLTVTTEQPGETER